MIPVEVAYARYEEQLIIALSVPDNCTVEEAIILSGILARFPEIDLIKNKVGIFGKLITLNQKLNPKDRIEIYRPLKIDPKQARLLRAKRKEK